MLRFVKEGFHFAAQGGHVRFKDSPSHLIGNESVCMDQAVAKGDDPAAVANPAGKARVQAEGLT